MGVGRDLLRKTRQPTAAKRLQPVSDWVESPALGPANIFKNLARDSSKTALLGSHKNDVDDRDNSGRLDISHAGQIQTTARPHVR